MDDRGDACNSGDSAEPGPERRQKGKRPQRWQAPSHRGRILIIDDEDHLRAFLGETLRLEGFEVEEAEDGLAGIAKAREVAPEVVLLDISMPGMDGFQVCQNLKEDPVVGNIPICFMSASFPDVDHIVRGLGLGASEYLIKPFSSTELVARLHVLVRVFRAEESLRHSLNQVRALSRRLRKANKRKDQFLSIISHDLLSPSASIDGYCQALAEGRYGELVPETLPVVLRIRYLTLHLQALIRNLLDAGMLESGRLVLMKAELELDRLIDEVLDAHRMAAGQKAIALERSPTKPGVRVLVDEGRFVQMLDNLISNAVKFTPAGGRIQVGHSLEVDQVVVFVSDSGPGIPGPEVAGLFKRYSVASTRPTANERSTGLGLWIVRRFADLHGFGVDLKSEVGQGSTFQILIPPEAHNLRI